jgi:hypothetical protein
VTDDCYILTFKTCVSFFILTNALAKYPRVATVSIYT